MFGSIARAAIGFTRDIALENTDADVDLLVVFDPKSYPETEQQLRDCLEEALNRRQTHVTWGPGLQPFYPFRDEERIDVDIECHQVGSDFYVRYPLLGYSIFRYFMPLYSRNQQAIVSYLQILTKPLTSRERWKLVVSDRQGLESFKKRLAEARGEADPRRLCTHLLRNVVWAITGEWPTTGKAAGQYLSDLPCWQDEFAVDEAVRLLEMTTAEVRNDLQVCGEKVRAVIDCCLAHAEIEPGAMAIAGPHE
jgi:predicted nucleotidyltransferase